eukprot:10089688-Prorocentrum_lima.AAC.1
MGAVSQKQGQVHGAQGYEPNQPPGDRSFSSRSTTPRTVRLWKVTETGSTDGCQSTNWKYFYFD